ncbi:MAG: HAMP domain-containing histidine kinase [Deltaproteobacteria bacterium]|nr:HAMP domain-containing histidine kinase [Deltaproteobacteria bacterium]
MSIKNKFTLFLILLVFLFVTLNLAAYLYISSRLFMTGRVDSYMISASIISRLVIEKGDKECYQVIGDRRLFEYMPVAIARVYKDDTFDYLCGLVNDVGIIKQALKFVKKDYGFFDYNGDYIAIYKNTDMAEGQKHLIIFEYTKDITNYNKLRNSIIIFDIILFFIFGVVLYLVVRRLYFKPFENLMQKIKSLPVEDDFVIESNKRDETALIISSVATLIRNLKNEKSELIRINEELKKTQNDLIRSERLSTVGKIAASIAHEVGTPLGTIRGYIDIINKGIRENKTENINEYLKKMDNEIVRISNILRELLDYAKPPKFNMKRDEIVSAISDAINFVKLQRSFSNIEIRFEPTEKIEAEFDRDRLKQILVNLLMNAKDAMNGNGKIDVLLGSDEKYIVVSIRDYGCGISESERDKIFEPFYTTKPSGQGSGLGLAIVKRLIESMNGKIEFESKRNEGTVFKIFLKK